MISRASHASEAWKHRRYRLPGLAYELEYLSSKPSSSGKKTERRWSLSKEMALESLYLLTIARVQRYCTLSKADRTASFVTTSLYIPLMYFNYIYLT